jgi:hypothetical protein
MQCGNVRFYRKTREENPNHPEEFTVQGRGCKQRDRGVAGQR